MITRRVAALLIVLGALYGMSVVRAGGDWGRGVLLFLALCVAMLLVLGLMDLVIRLWYGRD